MPHKNSLEKFLRSIRGIIRKNRKSSAITLLVVISVIIDCSLAWYIVSYSTERLEIEPVSLDFDIVDVEFSSYGDVLLRGEHRVGMLTSKGPVFFNFSGTPLDATIGDESGATAILNTTGTVFYYGPGEFSYRFKVNREGARALAGISEAYSTVGRIPEEVGILIENETGYHLELISIGGNHSTLWSYTFSSRITHFDVSPHMSYIAVALENNTVFHFSRIDFRPRQIYHTEGPVDELRLSESGISVGILHSNGSRFALFGVSTDVPIYKLDLPEGSRNLLLKVRAESAFVLANNVLLQFNGSGFSERITDGNMVNYTVPLVADKIYVSLPDRIEAFRGGRQSPRWIAETAFTVDGMRTDVGGKALIAYGANSIVRIDDSDMPLGDSVLWALLGLLVIVESSLLPVAWYWSRIMASKRMILYVLVSGALAGIAASIIFPDLGTVDWYGSMAAYLAVSGSIAALSTLVAFGVEGGIARIFIGICAGLVISIPVVLAAHFLLSIQGYHFAGSIFSSVVNTVMTGLKMGLIGGVTGFVIRNIR